MKSQEIMDHYNNKNAVVEDIDAVLCGILNIPKELYDSLPGKSGEKLLSEEEYKIIRENKMTVEDFDRGLVCNNSSKSFHLKLNNRIITHTISPRNSSMSKLVLCRIQDKVQDGVERDVYYFKSKEQGLELIEFESVRATINDFSDNYDLDSFVRTLCFYNTSSRDEIVSTVLRGDLQNYGIPLTWNVTGVKIISKSFEELKDLFVDAEKKGVSLFEILSNMQNDPDNPCAGE